MKFTWRHGVLLGSFLLGGAAVYVYAAKKEETVVVYSPARRIDKVIKSMEGEINEHFFSLLPNAKPELLWVTSGDVTVVDAETSALQPPEMLCHSHLMFPLRDFNASRHNDLMGRMTNLDLKLFTLIQGQTAIDLPKNFGIPVFSNETFDFSSMIISPRQPAHPLNVKAKGTFKFHRDSELAQPLKPLFWRGLAMMVPVQAEMAGMSAEQCAAEMHGVGAGVPGAAPAKASMNLVHKHRSGKFDVSYHWMVPPGRHEYRYTLEYGPLTPFDTTLHYINMHLHPYAESLELRDLTSGKSLFKGYSKNLKDAPGVAELTHFSSEKGIPIFRDHTYELVTVYNNTTKQDIDAMAILFVYYLDKQFNRDHLKTLLQSPPAAGAQKTST
jgi:hypothetical protein